MKAKRSDRCRVGSRKAFSIIETIGVLAVMAIIAAMLVPNVVRRIAQARGTREASNLQMLASGYAESVRRFQAVPGATTWAAAVAKVTGLSQGAIARVDPSDTNTARVLLIYPGFSPSTGSDPVVTNTMAGLSAPTNAMIMLISSSKPTLTLPVASGKASDTAPNRAAFNAIWDWSYNPATKAPPSGWPSAWDGQAEHLHVARLNLAPLFHHVTFSNLQFPTNAPFARFNGQATREFNVTNAVDGWYLEGTEIRLYKHDNPYTGTPMNPDELDMVHRLVSDLNLIYRGAPAGWTVP